MLDVRSIHRVHSNVPSNISFVKLCHFFLTVIEKIDRYGRSNNGKQASKEITKIIQAIKNVIQTGFAWTTSSVNFEGEAQFSLRRIKY